jgi:hypothetical protein
MKRFLWNRVCGGLHVHADARNLARRDPSLTKSEPTVASAVNLDLLFRNQAV